MEIKDLLKKHAIEYATNNTIAQYGEVVETIWANWKKPHKVKIYEIGAALVINSWYFVKGQRKYKKTSEFFAMYYFALRLKPNGTPKDKAGSGIVLNDFRKENGKRWRSTNDVLNHVRYHWRLPKSHLKQCRDFLKGE